MKRCSFSASASSPTQQKDLPCHCQNQRARRSKKYRHMTNDKLVNLCKPRDRPIARRVVDALRKYLIQVSESEGFDFDVFPGHFAGVTSVMPIEDSCSRPLASLILGHGDPEDIAQSVVDRYNKKHKKTEYKVENIEKMHMSGDGFCRAFTYYLTFRARDVKNEAEAGTMKTFQASVMLYGRERMKIFTCRIKANCCSSKGKHRVSQEE